MAGLYGVVVSYVGAQQVRDLAIRVALGARDHEVVLRVLRTGVLPAAVGIGLGVCGGFAATHLLAFLLYGIRPTDPTAFLGAVTLLGVLVIAACYVPARRARRVDPLIVLRSE